MPADILFHTTDVRKHPQFRSAMLDADRDLVVYVPECYEAEEQRRFPVLYLHDGQNLFDSSTSYAGVDWRVDKTAEMLVANHTIEPFIAVGIYNTGTKRIDEYTPTRDRKLGGGYADLYGRMITEEIMPFIESNYRTLGGPQNTGLGGSSLGGLVSLYLGLQYPECFGKLAVMSPSVWWNNRHILKFLKHLEEKPELKIWLDIGTAEGQRALEDARLLRQELVKKGWREGVDLRYAEARGATHSEAAWAARVAPMLHYLFPVTEER
ncbi:MAG: alpha/beta hydrolase [Acidobacteriales bacterium]|nr:alpha/beta hydrolase [Terriglobales bacterium]